MAIAVAEAGGLGAAALRRAEPRANARRRDRVQGAHDEAPQSQFLLPCRGAARPRARIAPGSSALRPISPSLASSRRASRCRKAIHPSAKRTCAAGRGTSPRSGQLSFRPAAGAELLERVKAAGCKDLEHRHVRPRSARPCRSGVDAIIAQGAEAGGHRGMFLETDVATQIGTFALVRRSPLRSRSPSLPPAASPMAAPSPPRFTLGASGVQIGTAYLLCPESMASALHKQALADERPRDCHHECADGTARARRRQPLHARARAARCGRPCLPARTARDRAAAREGRGRRAPRISRRSGPGRPPSCRRGIGAGDLTRKLAQDALACLNR